jgi:hypothetical protein
MIIRAVKFLVRTGVEAAVLTVALVGGGLIAHAVIREPLTGSGKPATENRSIGNVSELVISGGGKVDIVRGDMPNVRVTADDNILPQVETRYRNGKLTLCTKTGSNIQPVTPITYTVTLPGLEKLTVSGAGNVSTTGLTGDVMTVKLSGAGTAVLNNISCRTLNLTLSGAGHAKMSGSVERLETHLSGAGEIEARDLKTKQADTHISGAGTASVWATEDLKAHISGAGTIYYKGTPRIEQRVSGAGSVKPRAE